MIKVSTLLWSSQFIYTRLLSAVEHILDDIKETGGPLYISTDRRSLQRLHASVSWLYITPSMLLTCHVGHMPAPEMKPGEKRSEMTDPDTGRATWTGERYASGHMQLTAWNGLCLAIWAARREKVEAWLGIYGNSQQPAAAPAAQCRHSKAHFFDFWSGTPVTGGGSVKLSQHSGLLDAL